MKYKKTLATGVMFGLLAVGHQATATIHPLNLTSGATFAPQGSTNLILTGTTATWSYNDQGTGTTADDVLTSTGFFQARIALGPNTLYTWKVNDLVVGAGANAAASTFICEEGLFGPNNFSSSFCASYSYGDNFVDESTYVYGPGTLFSRTLGGDDVALAAVPQTLGSTFNGFITSSWNGATLVIGNNTATTGVQLTLNAADADADGVPDAADNCTMVANPTQLDTDNDGYGNICDADLNNSGTVTTADYGLLRSVLGQAATASATAANADMNGSGTVTTADYGLLRARLGTTPGPSGLACAGTVPCPPP